MNRTGARCALAVAVLGVAGCGVAGCGGGEEFPAPECGGGSTVLVEAQSVPTAGLLPCLDRLPDGWTIAHVRVDQGGTTVRLDSDRAGGGAAELRFRPSCDVTGAVRVSSDLPPAVRFDRIDQLVPRFRGARYYVSDGACTSWLFDFDDGVTATEAVAISDALQLVRRDVVETNVREHFVDEEL
jgi:hypothetical protein